MFDTKDKDQLRGVLDAVQIPAFSIEVLDGDEFVLSGINETHSTVSGMKYDHVVDQNPREILSKEDARHVLGKYRECALTQRPTQYFEKLDMPNGEISWYTSLIPIKNSDDKTIRLIGNAVGFKAHKDTSLVGHMLDDLDYVSAESAIPIYKALELVRTRLEEPSTRPEDRRYFSAFRDLCQTALTGSNRLRSMFSYLRSENGKVPALLRDSALSKAIHRIDPDWKEDR